MGHDDQPSKPNRTRIHMSISLILTLSFAETYRYNETPVYTASNGCPVSSVCPSTPQIHL